MVAKPWIHVAVEQIYNWLRGNLVAQAVQLEHLVDDVCAAYIAPPATRDLLQAAVLGEVAHSHKVELLKAILSEAGWTEDYSDLVARLKRVSRLRNLSVHALGPLSADDVEAIEPGRKFESTTIYFRRFGRDGLKLAMITQEDMNAVSADLPKLVEVLTELRERVVERW